VSRDEMNEAFSLRGKKKSKGTSKKFSNQDKLYLNMLFKISGLVLKIQSK
jgi:hypothetical protein